MSVGLIIIIAVVVLLALLAVGVPVAFSLAASGGLGLFLIEGWDTVWTLFGRSPMISVSRFTLVVVPMFVLMGTFAKHSGLAEKSFQAVSKVSRGVPAGLGLATVASCSMFAAVSGSSVATVATIGTMSIREMRRYGYSDKLSSGIIAAAGTIGILIPPSIALVIYGVIAEIAIGPLLLAGVIPGALAAAVYAAAIIVRVKRNPALIDEEMARLAREHADEVSSRSSDGAQESVASAPETETTLALIRYGSVGAVVRIGLLAVLVIGGLYAGIFTATEAASVGAVAAGLILLFDLRGSLRVLGTRVVDGMAETVRISSMAFMLLVGASIFNFFLVVSRAPADLAEFLSGLDIPPILIVIAFLLVLLPLGMVLDGFSMMLIMVPLAHPIITHLGFEGIWFAILFIKTIEVGLITPPLGLNIFVVAGADDQLNLTDVIRGVAWFIPVDLVIITTLVAFPQIVMFGPNLAQ